MATPRIFTSSTCYDLNEVRDSLYSFIDSLGYIPIFSDKNDVFYHPDLHSHDSCLKEIESCQIFLLVIGGRFGGNYKYDTTRSIVNAEYQAAKKLGIPIFTFIKREVHDDHKVYTRNKKEKPEFFDKIEYPSIEKQETVCNIFEFIDEVRKSDVNNAYFTFEFSRDIQNILIKQFAGMFYDFLWKRQKSKEGERAEELLTNLNLLGKKTEEIIENIYKKVDANSANAEIEKLNKMLSASRFWQLLLKKFKLQGSDDQERIEELSSIDKDQTWFDYLVAKGKFIIKEFDDPTGKIKGLYHEKSNLYFPLESLGGEISDAHKSNLKDFTNFFEDFRSIGFEERINVLKNIV